MKKVLILLVAGLIVVSFSTGVLADPSPVPIDDKPMLKMVAPK